MMEKELKIPGWLDKILMVITWIPSKIVGLIAKGILRANEEH